MPEIPVEQLGLAGGLIIAVLGMVYLILKVALRKNSNPGNSKSMEIRLTSIDTKMDRLIEAVDHGFERLEDKISKM